MALMAANGNGDGGRGGDAAAITLPHLDGLDRRLIELLQADGRASFTALGDALELSPDAARDRLRKLERQQVVRIIGRMEPLMLGYRLFAMLGVRLTGAGAEPLAAAAALGRVDFAARTVGRYDALIEIVCFDEPDLVENLDGGIRQVAGLAIADVFVYHDAVKWPGKLTAPADGGAGPPRQINEADRRILQHLQADGRATYAALAKSSELAISTTRRRVRSMLEDGILQIETIVHPAVSDRHHEATIALEITGPVRPVLERCAAIDEVTMAIGTTGRFDGFLAAATPDRAGMDAVSERVRAIEGVVRSETFTVLQVLKLPEAWAFPSAD